MGSSLNNAAVARVASGFLTTRKAFGGMGHRNGLITPPLSLQNGMVCSPRPSQLFPVDRHRPRHTCVQRRCAGSMQ